jgi:septal ring factor EnvC (AmiA/AmiB activator)
MFPTSLKPEWRNGRRDGLKIRYSKGCVGSTPTSGTNMDTPTLADVNIRGVAQRLIEKRLRRNSENLKQLQNELTLLDEQLDALRDDANDKEMRSLVSETPLALHEYRDAQKHVEALLEHRDFLLRSIAEQTRNQDELLDRLGKS